MTIAPFAHHRSARPRHRRRLGAATAGALLGLLAVVGYAADGAAAAEPLVATAAPIVASQNAPELIGASPYASYQGNVAMLTNRRRANAGRRYLMTSRALTIAAQRHANNMAAMYHISHTGSDGSNAGQRISRTGFPWAAWAENVAAGQTSSTAVVNAWMNSPSHRANMLNRTFTYVGVGVAWRNGVWFWCMVLASR